MRAEAKTLMTVSSRIVGLLVGISLAVSGLGVWSILGASFATYAVNQALTLYLVRFDPLRRFDFKDLRPMLGYGVKATFGSFVGFLTLNIQTMALGKYATAADVAFYNRAQALYQRPLKQLAWPLVGAALPAMSALQGDRERLLSLVNRSTWLLNLILAPFAILMIVSGDLVVGMLLGPEWTVAGEVIRWVAVAQVPLLFNTPLARANAAIGRPARSVWLNVVLLPVIIAGVIYFAPSGVVAVAIYIMIVRLSTYPIFLYLNLKSSGMPAIMHIRSLVPLWGVIVVMSVFGVFFRMNVGMESLWSSCIFMICLLIASMIVLYALYRRVSVGIEVLRWMFARFGGKLSQLEFLIP